MTVGRARSVLMVVTVWHFGSFSTQIAGSNSVPVRSAEVDDAGLVAAGDAAGDCGGVDRFNGDAPELLRAVTREAHFGPVPVPKAGLDY